jgi:haloalkane dehalogenase
LRNKRALILWGMKDKVLTPDFLTKWQAALPQAKTETFPDCGHFVCEECSRPVEAAVYLFMDGQAEMGSHAVAVLGLDADE